MTRWQRAFPDRPSRSAPAPASRATGSSPRCRWLGLTGDAIAAALTVGHLLECSGQISGGNLSEPGAPDPSVDELARLGEPVADIARDPKDGRPALQFKPEVASLNMGTMNFGLYEMLKRTKEFKFDWERPYLEGSWDRIFRNTFADIAFILE